MRKGQNCWQPLPAPLSFSQRFCRSPGALQWQVREWEHASGTVEKSLRERTSRAWFHCPGLPSPDPIIPRKAGRQQWEEQSPPPPPALQP